MELVFKRIHLRKCYPRIDNQDYLLLSGTFSETAAQDQGYSQQQEEGSE